MSTKKRARKADDEQKPRGPATLYPNKDRERSIHVQMPDALHEVLARNIARTRVRPGDLFCRLLERYGDVVKVAPTMSTEECARLLITMKKRGRIK